MHSLVWGLGHGMGHSVKYGMGHSTGHMAQGMLWVGT